MNYARNTFHKAAEAMGKYKNSRITSWLMDTIIHAQKFIVPDAGQMTAGKPFDDFKDCLKLPFPRIALLREIDVDGHRCQQVVVAASPEHVSNGDTGANFFVADALEVAGTPLWAPSRPIGIHISEQSGIQLMEIDGAREEEMALYGGKF
jgi:hypothetical protein